MKITTKYSVGDKVYIVSSYDMGSSFKVDLVEITGINIGGKYFDKYQFGYNNTRGEDSIYTDLAEAKKAALKKAKEHYDHQCKKIEETKLQEVYIQEEE